MIQLMQWAAQWGVSIDAVRDLERRFGVAPELHQLPDRQPGRSEAAVSADAVRQARELHGAYLFRNNSGAYTDDKGNHVRYGLGNISKQVNDVMKTPDYVGIWPYHCRDFVTHEPITIGQFVGIEMKEEGWVFTGKGRERGQMNFGELVIRLGGRFMFHSGGPLL